MASISKIALPDFGAPAEIPKIPAAVYESRLSSVLERMREAQYDVLVVYADREHSANIAYCTGFDPRFEEALFILTAEGQKSLIVGNECINILGNMPIEAEVLLCQEFSLTGQDRAISPDLEPLLPKTGLRQGMRCGLAGWKTLMQDRIEVPAYIVDLLTEACGSRPVNANDLFMGPEDGLRTTNEPEQLAYFEYAATRTSQSILNLLHAVKPGARCFDLARQFDSGGLPYSVHPMLAVGKPIVDGMASPGNDEVREGDYLTCAFGIWGSLSCRAGHLVTAPDAFESGQGRETQKVFDNYLDVVRAWYAALEVGKPAGEVWAAAEETRDDSLYTFCVNPGHYIHLDEWVCSPFVEGSSVPLPSGAAIQADIIPVSREHGVAVNMEDGIILADSELRQELERRYPEMYGRCQARRRFMIENLGYELSADVLPLGNMPGAYFPCLLNTEWICHHG